MCRPTVDHAVEGHVPGGEYDEGIRADHTNLGPRRDVESPHYVDSKIGRIVGLALHVEAHASDDLVDTRLADRASVA